MFILLWGFDELKKNMVGVCESSSCWSGVVLRDSDVLSGSL